MTLGKLQSFIANLYFSHGARDLVVSPFFSSVLIGSKNLLLVHVWTASPPARIPAIAKSLPNFFPKKFEVRMNPISVLLYVDLYYAYGCQTKKARKI